MAQIRSKLSPVSEAKAEVRRLIDSRILSESTKKASSWIVSLLNGRNHHELPKFTYHASNGIKLNIRYVEDENTIFEDEQNSEVEVSHINIKKETTIIDRAKLDFILASPAYGVRYELYDPMADAEAEIAKTEKFDKVWRQIDDSTAEVRKAIYIKATGEPASRVFKETNPELKLKLRNLTSENPTDMENVLEDPTLATLYLYHMALELKYIEYNDKTRRLKWKSGSDICTVPVDESAASYVSKILLEDNYLDVRVALDEKLK